MNERKQQLLMVLEDLKIEEEAGVSLSRRSEIEQNRKAIMDELAAMEEAEKQQQERAEEIEKKVAAIELPYDFNELYDNSTANDTIIEIVQQFKRQDLEEHNEDIEKLHQLYREQLRAAGEREIQLQRQNDELQTKQTETSDLLNEALAKNAQLTNDKLDAEQKRDNAVMQMEQYEAENKRLNSHIDDLLKEQAVGAREAYKVIESNHTLDQLIQRANEEKQARIKSAAELAAEGSLGFRGKVELPDIPTSEGFPFRVEVITPPATYTGNAELSAAETDALTGGQFPEGQAQSSGEQMAEHTDHGKVLEDSPVTRAEFEKRLAVFREEFKYELIQHYRVAVTQ